MLGSRETYFYTYIGWIRNETSRLHTILVEISLVARGLVFSTALKHASYFVVKSWSHKDHEKESL